jgi:hypothetical protein
MSGEGAAGLAASGQRLSVYACGRRQRSLRRAGPCMDGKGAGFSGFRPARKSVITAPSCCRAAMQPGGLSIPRVAQPADVAQRGRPIGHARCGSSLGCLIAIITRLCLRSCRRVGHGGVRASGWIASPIRSRRQSSRQHRRSLRCCCCWRRLIHHACRRAINGCIIDLLHGAGFGFSGHVSVLSGRALLAGRLLQLVPMRFFLFVLGMAGIAQDRAELRVALQALDFSLG